MNDHAGSLLTEKRKRTQDLYLRFLIFLCASFTVLLLAGIIVYVLMAGMHRVSWSFLTSVTSVLKGTVGIAGNIVNTVMIIFMTAVIATPVGVGAAIYLNEYARPGKLVDGIEFATETLSGIPSIIFGLFGMMFFGQTLGLGYSLLTGSLTLILMVLPLITRNTQEALKTVPDSYRHGAVGLGAGKWHTIRTALPRTIGDRFPKVLQSGGTMTIQLYLSATSEGDFETAFGIAVVLLLLVFLINLGTKSLAANFDVTRKK